MSQLFGNDYSGYVNKKYYYLHLTEKKEAYTLRKTGQRPLCSWHRCLCCTLSRVWLFVTPRTVWPARLLSPWDYTGKNTGVVCHSLLQGIFPTQGRNLCLLRLLYLQADSLPLSHLGIPTDTSVVINFLVILHSPTALFSYIFQPVLGVLILANVYINAQSLSKYHIF